MNKLKLLLLTATCSVATVSCESYGPNARTGTVIGGLAGAAAGGIIGHQSGRGLEGAAIGGALGAGGGALVGSAQDQRNRERQAYYDQQNYNNNGRYNDNRYRNSPPPGYYRY